MKYVKLKHASVSVSGSEASPVLAEFVQASHAIGERKNVNLELSFSGDGLRLAWNRFEQKPYYYYLDFEKPTHQLRSFPAPKQGAFNQALGKKTKTVIDATGGWGGDAMLMCMQGYAVTTIERLPIMATLLSEAFARLERTEWAINNKVFVPKVLYGDAAQLLPTLIDSADCVYLDPMFPPKKKKKAAVNKQMQLLQWLAGADLDANAVADIARENFPRLAVKRPDYAAPLLQKPSAQFSSKLVHYDVYL